MPLEVRTLTFSFILSLITTIADSNPYNPAHEESAFVQMLIHTAASRVSTTIVSYLRPLRIRVAQLELSFRHLVEDYILYLGWYDFQPPYSRGYIRQRALADYLYQTVANADDTNQLQLPPSSSSTNLVVSASDIHVRGPPPH